MPGADASFDMAVIHGVHPESGTVRVDASRCTACGRCVEVCPAGHLALTDGLVRTRDDDPFGCIACGHCMMVCPETAIAVSGRGISPSDLVALPPPEKKADPEQLAALMLGRRSVRSFLDRDVPRALLEQIVDAASSAPMGVPPWDVGCAVVVGRERVEELSRAVARGYERMLRIFRPVSLGLMRPFLGRIAVEQFRSFICPLGRAIVEARREGRDTVFWGAPAVLVFHASPYADRVDAAIACTYAMLAAEALGLGSTMIGSAPPILARDPDTLAALGVPKGNRPAISLIVGYPAQTFERGIRRHFSTVGYR